MDVREKLVELILSTDLSLSYSRESDALNIADVLIAHGVTVQEWISVKDRLPEKMQKVLTVSDTGYIHVDYVDKFGVWIGDLVRFCKVTHWMPLPQPPKGE